MEHTWYHWMHFVWMAVGALVGFLAVCLCMICRKADNDEELIRLRAYYEEHHKQSHKDKDSVPPLIMSIAKTPDDYDSHYSNGWIVLRQRSGTRIVSSLVAKVVTEVVHHDR